MEQGKLLFTVLKKKIFELKLIKFVEDQSSTQTIEKIQRKN